MVYPKNVQLYSRISFFSNVNCE